MSSLIIKTLLTPGRLQRRRRQVNSLCQREGMHPSLAKRGKGRFFNSDDLLRHPLAKSVTAGFGRKIVGSTVGFTLLEVLVATSLLGIAVAVVLQLFSANLRALSLSEDYVKASAAAQVKMRDILDDGKLNEKAFSEITDDGYRIDVTITEVLKERTMNLEVKLLEIDLIISWMKGTKDKSYTLRTIKVMRKEI